MPLAVVRFLGDICCLFRDIGRGEVSGSWNDRQANDVRWISYHFLLVLPWNCASVLLHFHDMTCLCIINVLDLK